jgi:hypothetical protein
MADEGKRWCFIITDARGPGGGFVPSRINEGDARRYLMGHGAHAAPWEWGDMREAAEQACANANLRLGHGAEAVREIVASHQAALAYQIRKLRPGSIILDDNGADTVAQLTITKDRDGSVLSAKVKLALSGHEIDLWTVDWESPGL